MDTCSDLGPVPQNHIVGIIVLNNKLCLMAYQKKNLRMFSHNPVTIINDTVSSLYTMLCYFSQDGPMIKEWQIYLVYPPVFYGNLQLYNPCIHYSLNFLSRSSDPLCLFPIYMYIYTCTLYTFALLVGPRVLIFCIIIVLLH